MKQGVDGRDKPGHDAESIARYALSHDFGCQTVLSPPNQPIDPVADSVESRSLNGIYDPHPKKIS